MVRWGPIAGGLCHSWGEIFLFINIWWREHSTVAYHGKHGMPYHTMPWYYHVRTQQSTKTKPTFGEQTPPVTLVVVTFDAPSQWPHLSLYCIQGALDRHDGQNSIGLAIIDWISKEMPLKRERISKGEFWGPKIHCLELIVNWQRNDKGKAFIVKSQSLSGSICFALLGSSPSIYCRQDGKKPLGATKQHSASLFSAYRFNWQSV